MKLVGSARDRRRQAGFTLAEVLVAIVLFAISVVGLVAMDARSAEAQRASSQLRDGERIAQEAMAELQSASFLQLLTYDFEGAPAMLPYDDSGIDASGRTRDFRRPPADIPASDNVPGSIRNTYLVYRRVDWVTNPATPPPNPPTLPTDLPQINALVLDVTVMWIDDSNPTMPPPADLRVTDLLPSMVDPNNTAEFRPYVGAVQLRTVRANDAVVVPP